MQITALAASLLAIGASALPAAIPDTTVSFAAGYKAPEGPTYNVHIHNACSSKKSFGTFKIDTGSWQMTKMSEIMDLAPGANGTIKVPFQELGVRLSGDARNANQWAAQQLVEMGFSSFNAGSALLKGIFYNLSSIGFKPDQKLDAISVCPAKVTNDCHCKQSKAGTPADQDIKQVWTAASQITQGSPADTGCVSTAGTPTDLLVKWC